MPGSRKTFDSLASEYRRRVECLLPKFPSMWNAPLPDVVPTSIRPRAGNGRATDPLDDDPRNWGIGLLNELWLLAKLTPNESQRTMELLCESVRDRHRGRVVNAKRSGRLNDREKWPAVLTSDVRRVIKMVERGALNEGRAEDDSEPASTRVTERSVAGGGRRTTTPVPIASVADDMHATAATPLETFQAATENTDDGMIIDYFHSPTVREPLATVASAAEDSQGSGVPFTEARSPATTETDDSVIIIMPSPPNSVKFEQASHSNFQSPISPSALAISHKLPSTEPGLDPGLDPEEDPELLELQMEIAEYAAEEASAKRKACEMKLKLKRRKFREQECVRGSA